MNFKLSIICILLDSFFKLSNSMKLLNLKSSNSFNMVLEKLSDQNDIKSDGYEVLGDYQVENEFPISNTNRLEFQNFFFSKDYEYVQINQNSLEDFKANSKYPNLNENLSKKFKPNSKTDHQENSYKINSLNEIKYISNQDHENKIDYDIVQFGKNGLKIWLDYTNTEIKNVISMIFMRRMIIKNAMGRISSIFSPKDKIKIGPLNNKEIRKCENKRIQIADFYKKNSIGKILILKMLILFFLLIYSMKI